MKTKDKIIVGVIIILIITPIIINEVVMRPRLALINDVNKIVEIIKKTELPVMTKEIVIDNGFKINNKNYEVKGHGVIFLEKNYSVMLSRDGMCALKMDYDDKIMFQKEECPNYRLVNGEKKIVNK